MHQASLTMQHGMQERRNHSQVANVVDPSPIKRSKEGAGLGRKSGAHSPQKTACAFLFNDGVLCVWHSDASHVSRVPLSSSMLVGRVVLQRHMLIACTHRHISTELA